MAATEHTLRIRRLGATLDTRQEFLDPGSDVRLRELLEAMARKAHHGWGRLNLADWSLVVTRTPGGPKVAVVTVDKAGRTQVKR